MVQLNNEHIAYVIKDLHYRGIVLEGLEDEVTDHICSAIEAEMDNGKRFINAYHHVLKSFGHTDGLRQIQKETIRSKNQTSRLMLRNYLKNRFALVIETKILFSDQYCRARTRHRFLFAYHALCSA